MKLCEAIESLHLEVSMKFEIVQGDERLSNHSGLALVGEILKRTNLWKVTVHPPRRFFDRINRILKIDDRRSCYSSELTSC